MKRIFWLLLTNGIAYFINAQNVGIGTNTPAASAMIDVSSTTKGTLITRMSTAQRKAIANPATGLLVFDIDKSTIYLYDGVSWLPMLFGRNENELPPFSIEATDGNVGDALGWSVDINGNYAIAGASYATINGNAAQGCAYIFFRNNGVWQQQQKITASDGLGGDYFGTSVSIHGNYAVVGAPRESHAAGSTNKEGSVYVFVRNGSTWAQQAKLIANDAAAGDWLGHSVSISGDYIAAGAPYKTIGVNISQGAVYIFSLVNGVWTYRTRISHLAGSAGDTFGFSVQIDGTNLIAGAPYDNIGSNDDEGSAYIFSRVGNLWSQVGQLTLGTSAEPFSKLGMSVAINGIYAVATAPTYSAAPNPSQTGIAVVYIHNITVWSRSFIMRPEAEDTGWDFGWSVDIESDIIIVGGRRYHKGLLQEQGRAWVYKRNGINWPLMRRIDDGNGQAAGKFGSGVAIDNFNCIVGAPGKYNSKGEVFFLNVQ